MHLNNVDPFEHIRQMQLNKIRINNFMKWDVAKYDEFIADGTDDYNIGVFRKVTIKNAKNKGKKSIK